MMTPGICVLEEISGEDCLSCKLSQVGRQVGRVGR